MKPLNIIMLAYPDNPVGKVFISTFVERGIELQGIVVENKGVTKNWRRMRRKIQKDGLWSTIFRMMQVIAMKWTGKNMLQLAKEYRIPVYRVNRFNSRQCASLLKSLNVDLLAIASAPILKDYVFAPAKKGCLNAHPGWLPKYRGIGANAYALQDGDLPGISVHFIDAGIDTGRIIMREKIKVLPGDTVARINDRAVNRGAELMVYVIEMIAGNELVIPKIKEKHGECYRAMPYSEVKKVNKKLKVMEEIHAV